MNLSFRHFYWRWTKNLFLLFTAVAILMTVVRIGFAFYFGESSVVLNDFSVFRQALFLGLRFDLMPLAYINILPFLILNISYFIPGKFIIKLARTLNISILVFGYTALVWLYVCDLAFYSYYQDHMNVLFFGLFEDDTYAVLMSVWKNYNVPVLLTIILVVHYLWYRFVKLMFSPFEFDLKPRKFDWKSPVTFLAGCVMLAFFARGTFNRLPLSIEDAYFSSNDFMNEVALNGPISLNRAIKIRKTFGKGEFDFTTAMGFTSWQDAYAAAYGKRPSSKSVYESLKRRTPVNPVHDARPKHVVMVVMESFGSYWNEENAQDFQILGELDKHFKQGYLFKNFLPSENGTIGSIVSVATAQPIRPGARFLSESEFVSTHLRSSGHLPYKAKGYDTHFIYGGKLGWRELGKFLTAQKYDHLWGADEMKESMPELNNIEARDLGNEWGIFDEYLFSFIEEQIRTATKPQFFLVLTTSNHPPFEYPTSYNPLPVVLTKERMDKITFDEELAMKRFLALQYANQKLGEFLTRMKSGPLREKFVLGLTGDHSYWINKGVDNSQDFKRWAVPFFISVPDSMKKNVDLTHFGSHEDIFPTLYHLTLSNQEYVGIGEDMIENSGTAQNSSGIYAGKEGAWHHGKFWKWKDHSSLLLEETPETPELLNMRNRAKGLISVTDKYLKEEKANTQTVSGNGQQ
ncbi:MAG: sulfatase-like hydrolase/transferase [Bdellovibrionota bacterium]